MKTVRAFCGRVEVRQWAVAWLAALVVIVATSPLHAFTLKFDENGNGMVSIDGAPFVSLRGNLLPDFSQIGHPLSLTYILPAANVPVGNGDIGILEPISGGLSDGVRFTDAVGSLFGATADRLIYYSDKDDGAHDLADTCIPANFAPQFTVVEIGLEGNNGFMFGSPNVYIGISDVPEPGSVSRLAVGIICIGAYTRRRRILVV